MLEIDPLTPAIGAEIRDVDFSRPLSGELHDRIYQALLDYLVIFFRGTDISPEMHLDFARQFGDVDVPHPVYPHVDGFENIVLLDNDSGTPPDTNTWHADLTFKVKQPFASIVVARVIPPTGGDTLWSSCYAAYERLSDGMRRHLEGLQGIHDMGDFRNSFVSDTDTRTSVERLNEKVSGFGHAIRPLIDVHPVTGRRFLSFNEAFVNHVVGLTTNESAALRTYLANHMNKPEDQVRWRWREGDIAMWDNRVTMHYAVADYLPARRCMNRVTVASDRRSDPETDSASGRRRPGHSAAAS